MKKIFKVMAVITALCVLSFTFTACNMKDTVLATVNGEDITRDDFIVYFNSIQSNMVNEAGLQTVDEANNFWKTAEIEGKKAADVARERALEEVVKVKIKCQKAIEQGLGLTAEDNTAIDEQIGKTITNIGGAEQYEKELKNIGLTPDAYKKVTQDAYLAAKLDNKFYTDEANQPSDEDIKKEVEDNYVKAKHILITTMDLTTGMPYDEAKLAEQKTKAESVLAQVNEGGDFDTLMKENSEDTGLESNPDGYTFTTGEFVPEFEETAFSLKDGEISGLVQSQYGYHIIKREPLVVTDESIAEIKESVVNKIITAKINEQFELWKKEADIKINEKALAKVEVVELKESETTPPANTQTPPETPTDDTIENDTDTIE